MKTKECMYCKKLIKEYLKHGSGYFCNEIHKIIYRNHSLPARYFNTNELTDNDYFFFITLPLKLYNKFYNRNIDKQIFIKKIRYILKNTNNLKFHELLLFSFYFSTQESCKTVLGEREIQKGLKFKKAIGLNAMSGYDGVLKTTYKRMRNMLHDGKICHIENKNTALFKRELLKLKNNSIISEEEEKEFQKIYDKIDISKNGFLAKSVVCGIIVEYYKRLYGNTYLKSNKYKAFKNFYNKKGHLIKNGFMNHIMRIEKERTWNDAFNFITYDSNERMKHRENIKVKRTEKQGIFIGTRGSINYYPAKQKVGQRISMDKMKIILNGLLKKKEKRINYQYLIDFFKEDVPTSQIIYLAINILKKLGYVTITNKKIIPNFNNPEDILTTIPVA